MNVGSSKVLNYEDQTIKLKEGKVVEINEPVRAKPTPPSTKGIPPGSWTVDVRQAMAQAKLEHRRVMLLFTGSDWSAFSQRFYKETLSSPEFARYAIDKLILVMLDFPKTINQSAELKARNEALMKAFAIEHLPTVVILNSEGKPVGKIPFEEGGPAKFIASVEKL